MVPGYRISTGVGACDVGVLCAAVRLERTIIMKCAILPSPYTVTCPQPHRHAQLSVLVIYPIVCSEIPLLWSQAVNAHDITITTTPLPDITSNNDTADHQVTKNGAIARCRSVIIEAHHHQQHQHRHHHHHHHQQQQRQTEKKNCKKAVWAGRRRGVTNYDRKSQGGMTK